jgi:hypothetical protein
MQEELRKSRMLQALREAAMGGRSEAWFEGKLPDSNDEYTRKATTRLLQLGLLEKAECPRNHYRPTDRGQAFLVDVVTTIGDDFSFNWYRVDEIQFSIDRDC